MHTHNLILIKEPSHGYKLYWCSDCGVVCEFLESGIAEMSPKWSKNRLLKENKHFKYKFAKSNSDNLMHKKQKRLGKSLVNIKSKKSALLESILRNK